MERNLQLTVDGELNQSSPEGVQVTMYLAGAAERIDGWVQLRSGSRQTFTGYHDVDGLILTGFMHSFAEGGYQVPMSMYPAALDPQFTDLLLDPGYLTTRPGERSMSAFYNTAIADPAVIAYDEAHKDVVTGTDVAEFISVVRDRSFAREIDVPVLSLQGQYDAGFCDLPDCPQAKNEPDAWGSAAQLELYVIPDAGHNIHLHAATAHIEFDYIKDWLRRHFSRSNPRWV